jgi:uncharacterized tellurite resistance protein B-like protein
VIDLIKRLVSRDTAHETGANPTPADGCSKGREVHLAACAVFLEVARIDNEFDERERQHILRVFEDEYGLSSEDVVELGKASEAELARSLDLWTFTNVINEHYSDDEKARLVELLWRVVYADGKMDEHENYFMHKLSRLLRLTHRDLIDAKLRVLHPQDGSGGG